MCFREFLEEFHRHRRLVAAERGKGNAPKFAVQFFAVKYAGKGMQRLVIVNGRQDLKSFSGAYRIGFGACNKFFEPGDRLYVAKKHQLIQSFVDYVRSKLCE